MGMERLTMLRYGVTDCVHSSKTICVSSNSLNKAGMIMKFSELWLREWVNPAIDSVRWQIKSLWRAWKLTV